MTSDRRAGSAAAVLILAVATAAMWCASPTAGDFWWSDAPRHALNGAFVRDFIEQSADCSRRKVIRRSRQKVRY